MTTYYEMYDKEHNYEQDKCYLLCGTAKNITFSLEQSHIHETPSKLSLLQQSCKVLFVACHH